MTSVTLPRNPYTAERFPMKLTSDTIHESLGSVTEFNKLEGFIFPVD
jgi:hypothetical protein